MGAEQSTPAAPASATTDAAADGANPGSKPSALVVCGPSGVGKGTLIKRLLDSPQGGDRFALCVSHTTRRPRPGKRRHVFGRGPACVCLES
jgi:guanylate kinase